MVYLKNEQPIFKKHCVFQNPYLTVKECDQIEFSDELLAITNTSLELNKTGWTFLNAEANPHATPKQQMKAIGFAEGFIFADLIYQHKLNLKEYFLHNYFGEATDFPAELYQFFKDNLKWMRKNAHLNRDAYWKQIAYQLAHFDGLVLGYQQAASKFLSEIDILIYMSSGDLLDVVKFALPDERKRLSSEELEDLNDHCSGLVRINKDELYLSQTAWFSYASMTRTSKEYKFNLGTNANYVKFSSYPGFSYSFDDWYAMDSGFMFFETTDSLFHDEYYELCSQESLLTWIRAPVAGRLAKDSEHFATLISKYNSGTYNNQWVIVDLDKFKAKETENFIWITEQIPGKASSIDVSEITLKRGFFPSYNVPSMTEVWQISGYPQQAAKNFTKSYLEGPRAKIFNRDAIKVDSIEKMKELMRYNDYKNDPLSKDINGKQDPGNAISSRYDLRTDSTIKAFGGFDNKIGVYNRTDDKYESYFISGPVNKNVEPWIFDGKLWCPRHGLPDGPYDYEWIQEKMVLRKK